MEKTVTDSPFHPTKVIPIDPKSGLIMITYTHGPDTDTLNGLEGPKLNKAIQKEVKRLFPEKAMHPKKGLWIVGESVSKHQAWIESALHSVEDFLDSKYDI
jgi:hypothetical protein